MKLLKNALKITHASKLINNTYEEDHSRYLVAACMIAKTR